MLELNLNDTKKSKQSIQDFSSNSISDHQLNRKSREEQSIVKKENETNLMSSDSMQNMRQFITHSIEEGFKQLLTSQNNQ